MMETTLIYWCSNGNTMSPLGGLIYLLACLWLATNLTMP